MGTSTVQVSDVKDGEDHPHAYGDKAVKAVPTQVIAGSSPRVWGQVSIGNKIIIPARIIPTRMGTSTVQVSDVKDGEDHPHAYGDKDPCLITTVFTVGSSPRVWGQVLQHTQYSLQSRIIPTRMGTSWSQHTVYA